MRSLKASVELHKQGYNLEKLLELDDVKLSESDQETYSVCLLTWMSVCQEVSTKLHTTDVSLMLQRVVRLNGLLRTVDMASNAADDLLHDKHDNQNLVTQCLDSCGLYTLNQDVLLILRFPKRLSITYDNMNDGLDDYLAINRNHDFGIVTHYFQDHMTVLRLVQDSSINMWKECCKDSTFATFFLIDPYMDDADADSISRWLNNKEPGSSGSLIEQLGYYSNGAVANSNSSIGNSSPAVKVVQANYWPGFTCNPNMGWTDTAVSVPKSYKKRRVICENDPLRNFIGQALRKGLEYGFTKLTQSPYHGSYRPDCQDLSRFVVLVGSETHHIATIDLSSASDSISSTFAQFVLPVWMFNTLNSTRATKLKIGKSKVMNNIFFTSGAACCFNSEMYIFGAVVEAAISYHAFWVSTPDTYKKELRRLMSDVIIYGDDIIVPDECFEIVCEFLQICRFTVNLSKSYAHDSNFRESCGMDAYDGAEVSSLYFPRANLNWDSTELFASLAKLQQACMNYNLVHTGLLLADLLQPTIKPVPFKGLIDIDFLERKYLSPQSGISKVVTTYLPGVAYDVYKDNYADCVDEYRDQEVLVEVTSAEFYSHYWDSSEYTTESGKFYKKTKKSVLVGHYPFRKKPEMVPEEGRLYVTSLCNVPKKIKDTYTIGGVCYTRDMLYRVYQDYAYQMWLRHGSVITETIDRKSVV